MARSNHVPKRSATARRRKPVVSRRLARLTRERTAYHEAGHAVVGVLLRWAIKEVSIVPAYGMLGHVRHPRSAVDYWSVEEIASRRSRSGMSDLASLVESPLEKPTHSRLRRTRACVDIAVRLAGVQAEKLFTGRWNERGAGFDRFQVLDLARQLATDLSTTPNRIIVCEGVRASRLLTANWRCVEAVASALLEHDRLTGREVRAIVKRAWRS